MKLIRRNPWALNCLSVCRKMWAFIHESIGEKIGEFEVTIVAGFSAVWLSIYSVVGRRRIDIFEG